MPNDLKSVRPQQQRGRKPGDAAIAVAEGVNREQVEDEGRHGQERRNALLTGSAAIPAAQHFHLRWGLFGGDGNEADAAFAVRPAPRQSMQAANRLWSDCDQVLSREDPIQRRTTSGEFFLRSVTRPGPPNHQGAQPIRRDGDSLNSIRRFDLPTAVRFPRLPRRVGSYFPALPRRSICSMALAKSAGVRMMMVFPLAFAVASEMLSGKLGPARK
jgi:hypothetical protein